ncbi:MAG: hypothetical protein U9N85_06980 [Bacteroidota bacterium]|nr:hypothetical protein [Bacteroidota bacterium]
MKTFRRILSLLIVTAVVFSATQAQNKPLLTVVNFDSQGTEFTPEQLGNLARMEVEKLDKFEVMDRYDVNYMVKKHDLDLNGCYGKICLTEIGQVINSEKMMSGTVETYGETMIVTIRLIDVKSKSIEKAHVKEFLNLPKQIRRIFNISVREMFELENDEVLVSQLTKQSQHENKIINPDTERLNLSGPRFGGTAFFGDITETLTAEKYNGGFDASPYMYMLGYQFEVQYLNAGKLQALFEFIPTITGAEQGLFLPNINILHGLRHNVTGWEFGLGLTLGTTKKADGYFDADNNWHLQNEWTQEAVNPYHIVSKVDSRGSYALNTGFIIAAGKSFKSGRMNIPVNLFCIPSKDGIRTGLTIGFNAKKDK